MKTTYIGTPDDFETTEVALFGMMFPKGEAVDVSMLTPDQQARLDGNPTFLTERVEGEATDAASVEIPGDWSEQHWKTRCALARAITGTAFTSALEADAAIEAELDRRAATENPAVELPQEPEPVVEPVVDPVVEQGAETQAGA